MEYDAYQAKVIFNESIHVARMMSDLIYLHILTHYTVTTDEMKKLFNDNLDVIDVKTA